MEASQAGQTGDGSQVSQETPNTDSNLTTPQADQPVPPETERTGDGQQTQPEADPQPTDGSTAESNAADAAEPQQAGVNFDDPYRKAAPLPERDQQAEHDERELARDAQRQEHNARTGGGDVQPGEKQAANERHLAKTAGEDTSSDDEAESQGD